MLISLGIYNILGMTTSIHVRIHAVQSMGTWSEIDFFGGHVFFVTPPLTFPGQDVHVTMTSTCSKRMYVGTCMCVHGHRLHHTPFCIERHR